MIASSLAHTDGLPLAGLEDLIWIGDIPALGKQRCPDRTAVIFADRGGSVTYAQLDRRCDAFVALASSLGLRPGSRVAYLGRNNDLFAAVLLGAIRARLVLVPLNWRLSPRELAFQIQNSASGLLIYDEEFGQPVRDCLALCDLQPPTIVTEGAAPRSENGAGADGRAAASDLRSLLDLPAPAVATPHEAEQPVLQLYTSGTTGNPKGVLVSHRALSLSRHAECIDPALRHLKTGTVMLSPMPVAHIGGISWLLMGLIRRGTVVLTSDASPGGLLKLIRDFRVEHIFIVATVLRGIVDELRRTGTAGPPLRGIFYGAMPMSERLLREAIESFGCAFVQFFGMTEISGSATLLPPEQHDLARPQYLKSVGRPYPGISVEIRGPDRRVLRRGEAGEIWVRSPTLMLGYSNLPEKTQEVVLDGWYATGDGGYMSDDGWLYLTDRIKDMIVSGGENVYPQEVEEVLRAHPSVLDAAVVGLADERWGECVCAAVQLRDGCSLTEGELQSFARQRVAAFKCPKRVFFTDSLPRTAAGKVQRMEVRRRLRELVGQS